MRTSFRRCLLWLPVLAPSVLGAQYVHGNPLFAVGPAVVGLGAIQIRPEADFGRNVGLS